MREQLGKVKTYENAVEVQRAERAMRDWRTENIREVGSEHDPLKIASLELVRQLKELGQ